jgi:5-methylcytosine-specific restriction endonuclease McrA
MNQKFNIKTASKPACLKEIEVLEKYKQEMLNGGYIEIPNFDAIKAIVEKLENELNQLEEYRSKIPSVKKIEDGFFNGLLKKTEFIPKDTVTYDALTVKIDGLKKTINEYEVKYDYRNQIWIHYHLINPTIYRIEMIKKRIADVDNEKALKYKKLNQIKSRLIKDERENRKVSSFLKKSLKTDGSCVYCDKKLLDANDIHVDHIIPINYNGLPIEENLVLVCSQCNLKKSNLLLREFIKKFNLDRDKIEQKLDSLNKRY